VEISSDKILDAKGVSCPVPIVRTKKAIEDMEANQVIEVQATDEGSKADIKAWADSTGHDYLGTKEDGEVFIHYIRKAEMDNIKDEVTYSEIVNLEQLKSKLAIKEPITILDVREQEEFAFGHIPGAINIPLGEIEDRFDEIDKTKELHVICRTGNRSDQAAQRLAKKGYKNVKNVIPGMTKWDGPTEMIHEGGKTDDKNNNNE